MRAQWNELTREKAEGVKDLPPVLFKEFTSCGSKLLH